MNTLKIMKLSNFQGELPAYTSEGNSGFDIRAQLDGAVVLFPGQREVIPTGLAFGIPKGFELQVRPRSGLAAKNGITIVNSPGTVDNNFFGEVQIILLNTDGYNPFVIQPLDRIAQLVCVPIYQPLFEVVTSLGESDRGTQGLGSSGIK